METIDPNNINRVLTEMLKHVTDMEKVIFTAYAVPDGLRHLRNFAKKRRKLDILRAISEFVS